MGGTHYFIPCSQEFLPEKGWLVFATFLRNLLFPYTLSGSKWKSRLIRVHILFFSRILVSGLNGVSSITFSAIVCFRDRNPKIANFKMRKTCLFTPFFEADCYRCNFEHVTWGYLLVWGYSLWGSGLGSMFGETIGQCLNFLNSGSFWQKKEYENRNSSYEIASSPICLLPSQNIMNFFEGISWLLAWKITFTDPFGWRNSAVIVLE